MNKKDKNGKAMKEEETVIEEADMVRESQPLSLVIRAQYVRDISFESPNAPDILYVKENPEMNVSFNMGVRKLPPEYTYQANEDPYEVVISVQVAAKLGGKTAFIIEVEYGVEAALFNVPEDKKHPMLYIETPRHAFPFIRQIVANLTQMGGFPPLFLKPIDFKSLYMERFAKDLEENSREQEKEAVEA
jgi:preprotein translocase subunit SecB